MKTLRASTLLISPRARAKMQFMRYSFYNRLRAVASRTWPATHRCSRLWAGVLVFGLAGCGGTLAGKIDQAMSGCISHRNADFVGGRGATSLDRPLPNALSTLADRIAYIRSLRGLESIAKAAPDQVTLVCALEIASHLDHPEVAQLLTQYSSHPDAAVAASAKRLLSTQKPLR
ncbi:MAG: hypothetical protein CK550_05485 [Gemmatimonadetes bacterium]|nr:MAG: hypothetical protein CK550_05485 [Gemmatimonadota bacterium]